MNKKTSDKFQHFGYESIFFYCCELRLVFIGYPYKETFLNLNSITYNNIYIIE